MSWWIELGYPPFEVGKGGFPRTGQVIKYYRERKMDDTGKAWRQKDLAKVLGMSEESVRNIENKDAGLDFERRQFLAETLHIPPVLLGIVTLEQISQILEEKGLTLSSLVTPVEPSKRVIISTPTSTAPKLIVDPQEYREQLTRYWKTDSSRSAHGAMEDVLLRTSTMYHELPLLRGKDSRRELHDLLCSYHQFIANLLRDRQCYDDAILHLDKAFQFATLLRNNEQKALVFYSRGYLLNTANQTLKALYQFNKAIRYEKILPHYLRAPIRMYTGLMRAKTAKTEEKQKEAIELLDSGGTIVRAHRSLESPYFIDFSLDRYHLDKTTALIATGKNNDAINELKLVQGGSHNVRKQAYHDLLQAQAYMNSGNYSQAASLAEVALLAVQDIDSTLYVARVAQIHRQLQKSPYQNNPDVARLTYLLSKQ